MSRVFWRTYGAIAAAVLLAMMAIAAGPIVEGRFFPVRVDQRMTDVERTRDGHLCWVWESFKARDRVSDNLNLFIDGPDLPGAVGAPFERDTGMPWVRSRAVSPFQWHRQPYCVTLPPYLKATDRVVVRQTAYYPGWLGLWHMPLHLPDVVSDAAVEP